MARKRYIDTLPLGELPPPFAEARRVRALCTEDIRALLRAGPVVFLVANLGDPLRVIPAGERFEFWKSQAQARIVDTARFSLEDFPGELAYVATAWTDGDATPIVLLEAYH